MCSLIKINSLDKRKAAMFLVVAIFSVFATQAHAQQRVSTEPESSLATQEGQNVTLLCRYGLPIQLCRITIPGAPTLILSPENPRNDGYHYFGAGLQSGQCGVQIDNVRKENHGDMKCFLVVGDQEVVGTIEIIIALPPMAPEIDVLNGNNALQADTELVATCASSRGRPVGQITWYLENDVITPIQSNVINNIDDKNTNMTLYTVNEKISYHVKPEDNLKRLRCHVAHPGYVPEGFLEAAAQIRVEFLPQALPEQVVTGLEIGRQATLSIIIHANPRPNVEWIVAGQVIRQGEQKDRFIVEDPIDVGTDQYNVTLIITELSLEDTTRNYILKSSNRYGQQTYNLRIGSASQGDEAGLGIVPIIAISIVSVFILLVVVLILVAKVTKRWCFAGDSLHPNGPDSEAQIAPNEMDDGKTHEHFEQHEKMDDDEDMDDDNHNAPSVDGVKNSGANGKSKGNTSV
ncbi:unnamed protein product [Diamesa serratosioi]